MRELKRGRWISTVIPGTPPSVNSVPLDTRNWVYRKERDRWSETVALLFNERGNRLPSGLVTVTASASLIFTTKRRRDAGNYKALIEKWLGDVLQDTGRIDDDTHDLYTFSTIDIVVEPHGKAGHYLVIDYQEPA